MNKIGIKPYLKNHKLKVTVMVLYLFLQISVHTVIFIKQDSDI